MAAGFTLLVQAHSLARCFGAGRASGRTRLQARLSAVLCARAARIQGTCRRAVVLHGCSHSRRTSCGWIGLASGGTSGTAQTHATLFALGMGSNSARVGTSLLLTKFAGRHTRLLRAAAADIEATTRDASTATMAASDNLLDRTFLFTPSLALHLASPRAHMLGSHHATTLAPSNFARFLQRVHPSKLPHKRLELDWRAIFARTILVF